MTDRRGFVLVVVGALLWGTGGVTGAALGRAGDVPPVLVASLRLLVAGMALTLVAVAVHGAARRRTAGLWRRALGVGLLAAGYQAAYFVSVRASTVAVATFLALGAAPVLVALAVTVQRRRRPTGPVLLALALGVAGLGLLVGGGPGTVGTVGTRGAVAGLLAAAAFAALTLVNRRPLPGGPAGGAGTRQTLLLTGVAFTVGGLVLLPVGASGAPPPTAWPVSVWGLVLLLGLVPTAAAYAAYFVGLRTVDATSASLVALLEPVTATVLAAALLREVPGAVPLLGGLLLLAATVTVVPRRAARRLAGPAVSSPTMDPGLR